MVSLDSLGHALVPEMVFVAKTSPTSLTAILNSQNALFRPFLDAIGLPLTPKSLDMSNLGRAHTPGVGRYVCYAKSSYTSRNMGL